MLRLEEKMGSLKLHGAKRGSFQSRFDARKDELRQNFIKEMILPALWTRKDAIPFLKPVDPVKQKVQGYFNIVKHPMDLGTIRTRLDNNFYQTSEQCLDDFKLIFCNAALCYPISAAIRKKARSLEMALMELLNDSWNKVERDEELKKLNVGPVLKEDSEVCQPTSSSKPEVDSNALLSPPSKRRRTEAAEPILPNVPIGNGSLSSYILASIEASCSNNREITPKDDWPDFEWRYRKKQLMFINQQIEILQEQIRLLHHEPEEDIKAEMKKLLDQQSQLRQEQKEWLQVESMEEYELKKQQQQRNY